MKAYLYVACVAFIVAGCTKPDVKEALVSESKPVNCATAEGDLRALTAEKAHVSKEIENGVMSIVPIGLVVNTVEGTEKARFEIGTIDMTPFSISLLTCAFSAVSARRSPSAVAQLTGLDSLTSASLTSGLVQPATMNATHATYR